MPRSPLIQYAGVPLTGAEVKALYPGLSAPEKKICALEKDGDLIRLKRNLYIVSSELSGKETGTCLCANHLYGPSYVSLQWALRYYGMIPERVFMMTSVTTKRSRSFKTPIGTFSYMQVPSKYFSIGVNIVEEGGFNYLMAGPEKALCDTILHDNHVPHKSAKSLMVYLENDLRVDMDMLSRLDVDIIRECMDSGRKAQIFTNLIKIIEA